MTVSITGRSARTAPGMPNSTLTTATSAPILMGAYSPEDGQNRQSNLERIIAAIKDSPETVTPHPSVSNTIVVGATATTPATDNSSVKLTNCPFPDDSIAYVPEWPIYDVSVATREGARIVYTGIDVQTSSTTAAGGVSTQSVIKTLLQLPVNPQKSAAPNCVPSDVVGVTPHGTLIFNHDVTAYRSAGADTLIGYARDGFPIYGNYTGQTDRCGGYQSATGYRYTIAPDRKFILGCFVGTPQKFTFNTN